MLERVAERGVGSGPELPVLRRVLGEVTAAGADPVVADERGKRVDAELLSSMLDAARPGSLRAVVAALGRTARTLRDRLAADAWRLIAGLDGALAGRRGRPLRRAAEGLDRLDALFLRLTALDALIVEGMTRGEGWRFLDMGRRLERAMHVVALLRGTLSQHLDAGEAALLEALLEVGDSLMTYRRRYRTRVQAHAVIDLLLADETNPRSLVFQLHALEAHVRALPRELGGVGPSPEERIIVEALTAVRLASIEQLARVDEEGRRPALVALLAQLGAALPAFSEVVSQSYLSHAQMPRQLGRSEV